MVVVEVGDSLLQLGASLTLLNGHDEQLDVGVQRELVHGVDATHVVQHKEQDRGSLGTRAVTLRETEQKTDMEYCPFS